MNRLTPLKIALIYAFFGFLWILFSDRLLEQLGLDSATLSRLQTLKGWFYVLFTACLVYLLVRKNNAALKMEHDRAQESERKYQTLFEAAGDAIFIMQGERIKLCNSKSLELFNCTREELIGRMPGDFSPPSQPDGRDSVELSLEKIRAALSGTPQSFEWQYKGLDNTLFHSEVRLKALELGGEQYLQAIVRDVTKRKEAEEELRRKEQQQSLLLRSLPMAFYVAEVVDSFGGDWVNEQIKQISGFSRDDFNREKSLWLNRIHPDDRGPALAAYARVREAGSISVDYRWLTADRGYRWFHDEGVLIYDKQGEAKEIAGAWLDITDRKEEQETLLLTRHTVDNSYIPIVWLVEPQVIVYANEATSRLTGFGMDELLAGDKGFLDPGQSTRIWEEYFPRLKRHKSLSAEFLIRQKHGPPIPVLMSASYIEYGKTEYAICYFQDLRQRKKLEQELRQAQKMEAIGTLAGGIAHDFNNILAAIFGYAELAKASIGDPVKLEEDLDEVLNGASRAKELVRQILTFSRQSEQEKQPVELSLIVKEALKLLRSSIPATIEIKSDIASKARVLADPTQLHQIVMNLCTNAYHAMREEGGILAVNVRDVEIEKDDIYTNLELEAGGYVVLEVSDSGKGMDEETRLKIFEPYFTTKTKSEGTGLGLAVVHGIVRAHGGIIKVYTEIGRGTTFQVYLPVLPRQQRSDRPAHTLPPENIVGGNEHILYVDDEAKLTIMVRKALEKYGYRVSSFTESEQALAEFVKDPGQYDLVITDMTMPRLDGAELSRRILGVRSDIPVLLCTGHSEAINREKALALGIREYCEKPLSMHNLVRTVRQVLDGK